MKTRIKLNSKKIKKYSGRKKNSRFKHKKYSKLRGGANTLVSSLSPNAKLEQLRNSSSTRGTRKTLKEIKEKSSYYIPYAKVTEEPYHGIAEYKDIIVTLPTQSPDFQSSISRYYDAIDIFNELIEKINSTIHFNLLKKKLEIKYKIKIENLKDTHFLKITFFLDDNKTETIYIYYTVEKQQILSTIVPNDKQNNYKPLKTIDLKGNKIYVIKENTNQNITIETDIIYQKSYSITPIDLNVDTLQLASIDVIEDKDNTNTYISFKNNFPSLVIKNAFFSFQSSRVGTFFVSVYEDNTFDENTVFEMPYLDNYYEKYTNAEKQYKKVIFTNRDLFRDKKAKFNELILKYKSLPKDNTFELECDKLFSNLLYYTEIKIVNPEKEKSRTDIKECIGENISWVLKNALWLEQYLKLDTKYMKSKLKKKEDSLKGSQLLSLISKEYDCDISGLDEKYIIVDNFVNDGDGKIYYICGYPETKTKEIILNFWQDESMKKLLDKVHLEQKDNNINSFLDLFKEFKNDNTPIKNYSEGDLYIKLRAGLFDYIENRYSELYKDILDDPDYINFKLNFRKNAQEYFEQIGKKYLPKPMTKINYIFLVFTKIKDNSLEPFIFNVKELIPVHKPILKQIERLIKHELPYRFGILIDSEYNNGIGTKTDPFDDEYKLWYSRYKYGDFFHIQTEYVHTMSNISDKAHGYKNSITLEELTYASGLTSGLGNPFFKDIRLDYEVRNFKIGNKNSIKDYGIDKLQIQSSDCKSYEVGKPNESRSELVFCLYEKEKIKKEAEQAIHKGSSKHPSSRHFTNTKSNLPRHTFSVKLKESKIESKIKNEIEFLKTLFTLKNQKENKIKFILMFKTHQQTYTFIYIYDGKFYKLVIESNMSNILDNIINELNKKVLSNNFEDMTIKFTGKLNNFRVVSNNELDDTDYKKIFSNNPCILMNLEGLNNNNIYNNEYIYYSTSLLDYTKLHNYNNKSKILNLYNKNNHKPILLMNYLKKINNDYTNNNIKYYGDIKL